MNKDRLDVFRESLNNFLGHLNKAEAEMDAKVFDRLTNEAYEMLNVLDSILEEE